MPTPRVPETTRARHNRAMATYWQVRMTAAIDTLEREARRMLQLEEEQSVFSLKFYAVVGDTAARLSAMEAHESSSTLQDLLPELSALVMQSETRQERQDELKTRYQLLAKEIYPDRTMIVDGEGVQASHMHRLNVAYQHSDLAALIRLEAERLVAEICHENADSAIMESALYEIKRAADTYADAYRALLCSPLNGLMLRVMAARQAGWDLIEATQRKIERAMEEKERVSFTAREAMTEWQAPSQVM